MKTIEIDISPGRVIDAACEEAVKVANREGAAVRFDFNDTVVARGLKGPFMLIKAEDALYPQHDLQERLRETMAEWKPWLKEQAAERLAETDRAHPDVVAHWKKLTEAA